MGARTRTHTHTSTHFNRNIGFHHASSQHKFPKRDRKVVRARSLIVSRWIALFFSIVEDSSRTFSSNRKSSPALIAAKTRRDNCRHLNPPLSQIASRNFFFPASYNPIATGMSLNAAEEAYREITRTSGIQTVAKSTPFEQRRRYPKLF